MAKNLNQRLDHYSPAVLSLFRFVYGLLFAGFGSMTLFHWPVPQTYLAEFGAWPGCYAAVIQFVGGLLIATGLFTPRCRVHCLGGDGGRLLLDASAAFALADR
jgi:putative oxidoreductase